MVETGLGFLILIGGAFLLAVIGNAVSDFHRAGMERVRKFDEREGQR